MAEYTQKRVCGKCRALEMQRHIASCYLGYSVSLSKSGYEAIPDEPCPKPTTNKLYCEMGLGIIEGKKIA